MKKLLLLLIALGIFSLGWGDFRWRSNIWNALRRPWNIGIPSNYLVSYKFDDSLTDETGNFNGSAIGSPAYTTGLNGKSCFHFNGSNGIATTLAQSDLTSGYSFSFFLKPTDMTNSSGWFQQIFDVNPSRELSFMFDQSEVDGYVRAGWLFDNVLCPSAREQYDYEKTIKLSDVLTNGTWAHIGITYNRSTNIYAVYVDGICYYKQFCGYLSIDWPETLIGDDPWAIQGTCIGDNHIYIFNSGALYSYDKETRVLITNKSLSDYGLTGNGDGYFYDGKVYLTYYKGSDPRTEIGILCLNPDLTLDTSFDGDGILPLTDAFTSGDCYGASACTDGVYNYFSNYEDWKLYKYSLDWSTYIGEIDLSGLRVHINGSSEWKSGNYESGGWEGIVYDNIKNKFWLTYHSNMLVSINYDFDVSSAKFTRTYQWNADWERASLQGLDFVGYVDNDPQFWMCDRDFDPKDGIKLATLTRGETPRSREWTALRLGTTHGNASNFKNLYGQMQNFKLYGYDVGSKVMKYLAKELTIE